LHFQVVTLPQLPGVTSTSNSVSYASYWANGVSKTSRNSEIAWDFLNFMTSKESLTKLYKSLESTRGYGNLYPRVDMQSELLSDPIAGPFIYQASFARSWYLYDKTFDGVSGINSQVAKPFADTIATLNLAGATVDQAVESLQVALTTALANYGLVAKPLPTQ
jgi:ABC-type glycerol-3-phosphate transport system substrate-binding protein